MAKFLLSVFFILGCFFVKQNNAQDIIQTLIGSAQAIVNAGTQMSAQLLQAVGDTTKFVETELQQAVNETLALSSAAITTVVDEAQQLGSNAQICLGENQQLLQDFATNNALYLSGCVLDYVYNAISISERLLNDTQTLAELLLSFQNDLNTKCPNPFSLEEILCDTEFVLVEILQISYLSYDIANNVWQGYLLYQSLYAIPVTLPTCLSTRGVTVALNALPVAGTLAGCTVTHS